MIDLGNIKAGMTVEFRSGGKAVVRSLSFNGKDLYVVGFSIGGCSNSAVWYPNGEYCNGEMHPFDIVEIIPEPFNWDDVKWGMGFESKDKGSAYYYIGDSIRGKNMVVVQSVVDNDYIFRVRRDNLTRAPEHDIEVKS